MHSPHLRAEARQMHADDIPFAEIHRRLGLSRNTVACWLYRSRGIAADDRTERCPFRSRPPRDIDDPAAYAYLLGQYLGDGHLLTTQRAPLLTVMCDIRYPGVMHEVSKAMESAGARSAGFQNGPAASVCDHTACIGRA